MRRGLPVPPARPTALPLTRTLTDRPVLALTPASTSAPSSGTPQRLSLVAEFTIGAVGLIGLTRPVARPVVHAVHIMHAAPAIPAIPARRNGVIPAVLRLTPAQRIG
ncbi:hypothetical protein ACH4G3_07075 [Streptomyces afghaniensis]|uniref:hypothetical protein n=1 Tax=Streptomyces afghaniensis TaxID=66865 RepID=UPI0037A39A44